MPQGKPVPSDDPACQPQGEPEPLDPENPPRSNGPAGWQAPPEQGWTDHPPQGRRGRRALTVAGVVTALGLAMAGGAAIGSARQDDAAQARMAAELERTREQLAELTAAQRATEKAAEQNAAEEAAEQKAVQEAAALAAGEAAEQAAKDAVAAAEKTAADKAAAEAAAAQKAAADKATAERARVEGRQHGLLDDCEEVRTGVPGAATRLSVGRGTHRHGARVHRRQLQHGARVRKHHERLR